MHLCQFIYFQYLRKWSHFFLVSDKYFLKNLNNSYSTIVSQHWYSLIRIQKRIFRAFPMTEWKNGERDAPLDSQWLIKDPITQINHSYQIEGDLSFLLHSGFILW